MENWEVAAALERMAGLLALKGENDYKVRAYSHAARQVIRCTEPLSKLIAAGTLRRLPGIGAALRQKSKSWSAPGEAPSPLSSGGAYGAACTLSIPGIGYKTAPVLSQGCS